MNDFLREANADPRLRQVRHNGMADTAQMRIRFDYAKLSALGLDIATVNNTLSTAMAGSYVNDFLDRGRIKEVWVQGDIDTRMQPEDILRWHVRNNKGEMVPFSAFSTISWEYGSPRPRQ